MIYQIIIPDLFFSFPSSSDELEVQSSFKFNLGLSSQKVRLTLYGLFFSFPPWWFELRDDEEDFVGEEDVTGIADAPIDQPSNRPGVMSGENEPGKIPRDIVNIKEVFPQPLAPHTKIWRSSVYTSFGAIADGEGGDRFSMLWLVFNLNNELEVVWLSLSNDDDSVDLLWFTMVVDHNKAYRGFWT